MSRERASADARGRPIVEVRTVSATASFGGIEFGVVTPTLCTNTCTWGGDGACDDGGPGSSYSLCALGTDCTDCGPR